MAKELARGSWILPDAVWERMESLLPTYRPSPGGGRPRVPLRKVANGIFYVLRTGCQWNAAPAEYGSGSTLHRYFQAWQTRKVFKKLWKRGVLEYDELEGIDWEWQAHDGAMTKAPLGGGENRSKPDRSGQIGDQAIIAHRWRGGSAGNCGRGCQHTRQVAG